MNLAQLKREPRIFILAVRSSLFLIRAFECVYYRTQVRVENRASTMQPNFIMKDGDRVEGENLCY